MNISVVIPNYNGEELLRKNLPKIFEAISAYKEGPSEIIVADDASADNSINQLRNLMIRMNSQYPKVKFRIIKNKKNLGFSSNVNKGAANADGDVIVLLNTDVMPNKDFLNPLLSHFKDENIFAAGCMDKSIENGKVTLRGRGIGFWKRGFLRLALTEWEVQGAVHRASILCGTECLRKRRRAP